MLRMQPEVPRGVRSRIQAPPVRLLGPGRPPELGPCQQASDQAALPGPSARAWMRALRDLRMLHHEHDE